MIMKIMVPLFISLCDPAFMVNARATDLERFSVFMNFMNSEDMPVNELAERWNFTPQKIANMICGRRNPQKRTWRYAKWDPATQRFPQWIVRNEEQARIQRGQVQIIARGTQDGAEFEDETQFMVKLPQNRVANTEE
jgi:hypothetical protein